MSPSGRAGLELHLKQHPLSPSQPSDASAAQPVKVLFASGSPAAIALALDRLKGIMPELPLVIVSEFEPPISDAEWIRYHVKRGWRENRALVRTLRRGASWVTRE